MRLKMGMVGGGPGGFIGPIHRLAANLDGDIDLVAAAFSSDTTRSSEAGRAFGVDPARAYPDVATMLAAERERSDPIDFVTIASPNHTHLPVARVALEAGFAVFSDKPATATWQEARALADAVKRAAAPYRLTYTYSGYPLVREARARIRAGELGDIRKIVVEYSQGWLAQGSQGKQAEWRVDPARAGEGGCIADIGVHALHLAEFTTGLRVSELLADLGHVVPGRRLDDDCTVLLRFENGARGVLLASQIEIGEGNGLRIRIYGDLGGLVWRQEDPNVLWLHHDDGRTELLRAGDAALGADARARTRTPGGHPKGYIEAFANLYRDFAALLRGGDAPLLPGIDDGLRGMASISIAVHASRSRAGWTRFDPGAQMP